MLKMEKNNLRATSSEWSISAGTVATFPSCTSSTSAAGCAPPRSASTVCTPRSRSRATNRPDRKISTAELPPEGSKSSAGIRRNPGAAIACPSIGSDYGEPMAVVVPDHSRNHHRHHPPGPSIRFPVVHHYPNLHRPKVPLPILRLPRFGDSGK